MSWTTNLTAPAASRPRQIRILVVVLALAGVLGPLSSDRLGSANPFEEAAAKRLTGSFVSGDVWIVCIPRSDKYEGYAGIRGDLYVLTGRQEGQNIEGVLAMARTRSGAPFSFRLRPKSGAVALETKSRGRWKERAVLERATKRAPTSALSPADEWDEPGGGSMSVKLTYEVALPRSPDGPINLSEAWSVKCVLPGASSPLLATCHMFGNVLAGPLKSDPSTWVLVAPTTDGQRLLSGRVVLDFLPKLREQSRLLIINRTDHDLSVRYEYESRVGSVWKWLPGDSKVFVATVPRGKTHEPGSHKGRRLKIWAEAKDADLRWAKNRKLSWTMAHGSSRSTQPMTAEYVFEGADDRTRERAIVAERQRAVVRAKRLLDSALDRAEKHLNVACKQARVFQEWRIRLKVNRKTYHAFLQMDFSTEPWLDGRWVLVTQSAQFALANLISNSRGWNKPAVGNGRRHCLLELQWREPASVIRYQLDSSLSPASETRESRAETFELWTTGRGACAGYLDREIDSNWARTSAEHLNKCSDLCGAYMRARDSLEALR